jgi:DNA-binding transcriptional ArsR family regulator
VIAFIREHKDHRAGGGLRWGVEPICAVLSEHGCRIARVGKALANPTRRRVLVQLIDGPRYPAEMADSFGTTRANLSNHLTCLRECVLVTATAEGRLVR